MALVELTQIAKKQVLLGKYCPITVGSIVVVRQPAQSLKKVKGIKFSSLPHSKPEKFLIEDYLSDLQQKPLLHPYDDSATKRDSLYLNSLLVARDVDVVYGVHRKYAHLLSLAQILASRDC